MPYDSGLDKQLFSKAFATQHGKILVSVNSYNNGPKKLQLVREVKNQEGHANFVKIGRLSKEEVEGVLPLIQEALAAM
jgi:predicted transcriptional regulator